MTGGTRHQREERVPLSRSQRLSRRIKKIKASISDLFSRRRGQTNTRARTAPDLRREAIQQRREGKRLTPAPRIPQPPAQPRRDQRARLSVPQELRGPVDRKPLPPSPEHRLRRRPAFRQGRDDAYYSRGASQEQHRLTAEEAFYRQRPLPRPPTSEVPQFRQESTRGPGSALTYRQMHRSAVEAGHRSPRVRRDPRLDVPLPPPEHEASSPLFPAPLNLSRSASGRQVRQGVTPGPRTGMRFEPADREPLSDNGRIHEAHGSAGRADSATLPQNVNLVANNAAGLLASESSRISSARPRSLRIYPGNPGEEVHPALRDHTPPKSKNHSAYQGHASMDRSQTQADPIPQGPNDSLRAMSRHSSERKAPAPRSATSRPSSLPARQPTPPRIRQDSPMHPPSVHAVAAWLSDNLSHVPYAITSLSALSMWGFTRHLPTHISILCPEHCRDVVTGWAVATGVALFPRQRGFGLQLRGEGGQMRRVRVKFVDADAFAGLGTVGPARVLSLASLVDVLAGEFMDMAGENAGEKRVVLGGGIIWAVERMVEAGATAGGEELRYVGNPLFLEPFACTFPGSRETFVRAGFIPAPDACEQRPRGAAREGLRRVDGVRRAPPHRVPWAAPPRRR